ncbi:MAG: TIGR03915 family putative DNA repair protein [Vampirovibrionales bacterium]|nr:TIGR03915 family putative DNA repair protein [Vampirovibrionales bacterium]
MQTLSIREKPGFTEWRDLARDLLQREIPPEQTLWECGAQGALALGSTPCAETREKAISSFRVSRTFLELCELASRHQDDQRYALLYRLLWRLHHEDRRLLARATDDDVMTLARLVKAVRRDAYKIKAFVRFREVKNPHGEPCYVCWYQPEHYTLELALPFFTTRFRNMRWSLMTPYRAAHWDGEALTLEDNPDPSRYPAFDEVERYWLQYYASIFNPARLKVKAMSGQMPQKYWKNLPEAALIPELIRRANPTQSSVNPLRPARNTAPQRESETPPERADPQSIRPSGLRAAKSDAP